MSLARTLTSRGLAVVLLALAPPAAAGEPAPGPELSTERWPDQVLPPGVAAPPPPLPPPAPPPVVLTEPPWASSTKIPRPGRASTAGGIALLVLGTLGFLAGQVVLAFGASEMAFETAAHLPTNRGGELLAVGAYVSTGAAGLFAGGGVLVHWGRRADAAVEPRVHPPPPGPSDASGGLTFVLRF